MAQKNVTVDVKNTGTMAGKEVVLLYSSDPVASMVPDNRRLRDFTLKVDSFALPLECTRIKIWDIPNI